MEKANIDRINELSRLSRQRELTGEEQRERQLLRENYLKAFRAQVRGQLDSVVIEYPDHTRIPLRKTPRKK